MANCAATLAEKMCQSGFKHEQSAFWAQQSASVRQRFAGLETFGDKVLESKIDDANVPRLRSALGFDHDNWGQILRLNQVGEASSQWTPAPDASVHATVSYAPLEGPAGLQRVYTAGDASHPAISAGVLYIPSGPDLSACVTTKCTVTGGTIAAGTYLTSAVDSTHWNLSITQTLPNGALSVAAALYGYPLLDHPDAIQVFPAAWSGAGGETVSLRAREALYRSDGGGNLSDICLYPGGSGFHFVPGMCGKFGENLLAALGDGYSSMETALRRAYDKTDGLPTGGDEFNAVIHHRFVDYDQYGNLTHAISPLSANREWIERRFDYSDDPFRKTATYTSLTRCVADTPGAGADSPNLVREPPRDYGCEFGLKSVPAPIARRSITHVSKAVVDPHFGLVAKTEDVNGNSTLVDFDRWGRFDLIARSWGNAPSENATFQDRLTLATQKLASSSVASEVKDWRLLALADYAQVHGQEQDAQGNFKVVPGLLRSNVRRFEPSDSYSGLLVMGKTTRETAAFADGLGRPVQSIRDADVCLGVHDPLIQGTSNDAPFTAGVTQRCTATAMGVVTPAPKFDALGRDLQTFESYSLPDPASLPPPSPPSARAIFDFPNQSARLPLQS